MKPLLIIGEETLTGITKVVEFLADGILSRLTTIGARVDYSCRVNLKTPLTYCEKDVSSLRMYGVAVPEDRSNYVVALFNTVDFYSRKVTYIIPYKVVYLPGFPNTAKTTFEVLKRLCYDGELLLRDEGKEFDILGKSVESVKEGGDVRLYRVGVFVHTPDDCNLVECDVTIYHKGFACLVELYNRLLPDSDVLV